MQKKCPAFIQLNPPRRVSRQRQTQLEAYQHLAAIYLLRFSVGLSARLKRKQLASFVVGDIGVLLGLTDEETDLDEFDFEDDTPVKMPSRRALAASLRKRLQALVTEGFDGQAPLFANIELLGQRLELTAVEQELLTLGVLLTVIEPFQEGVSRYCRACTLDAAIFYLQLMTTRSAEEIHEALQPDATLSRMGWLELNGDVVSLDDKLALSSELKTILLREHQDGDALLANFYQPAASSRLDLNDFAYLRQDAALLVPYLQSVLKNKCQGVNILLYGRPGMGKTEFASVLAQAAGAGLYEVRSSDQEGHPLRGQARLIGASISQTLLSKNRKPCLLLFDEAEDAFSGRVSEFFGDDESSRSRGNKAWVNRQLETNRVPTIWITNRIDSMDSAYLRRFHYSVAMDSLPLDARRRIVDHYCQGLPLSKAWRTQVARQDSLTPAQIEKAVQIARQVQRRAAVSVEAIAEQTLAASRRLLDQKNGICPAPSGLRYDPALTNTDIDIPPLIAGLERNRKGALCFYGAPGTGKTALAHYLAEVVKLPLLIRRASDVIDKYVGESEKNIAAMFAEAQQQGGILLLDEADSLLADRRQAHAYWEISQVNELLSQMEAFTGIFICTTNLMSHLDPAAMRRFDFKVRFDYLTPDQRWRLFIQECDRLSILLPIETSEVAILKQQIQQLTSLTPGDFAVFSRQHAILDQGLDPAHLLTVLKQECQAKGESFGKVGFIRV